jgi:cyclophilin family peptidyl-prolyl cis-trans isomerase
MRALALTLLALCATPAVAQKDPKKAPESKPTAKKDEKQKPPADPTAKDKAIVAIDKFIAQKKVSTKNKLWRESLSLPPKLSFDDKHDYLWVLKTSKGEITIRLLTDSAPMHCSNAIYLTRLGFYDGLTFHRVVAKFMAQGGCPNGTGTSTIGYTFDGELEKKVLHDKPGLVSAANGGPGTDGAQFFVTFAPASHLDGKHTVYGEVTAGMDAVAAIEACAGAEEKPTERIAIERATIRVVERPAPDAKGK